MATSSQLPQPQPYKIVDPISEERDWKRLSEIVGDARDKSIRDVMARLGFISKIQPNELLDITTMTLTRRGIWNSLYRTFIAKDESREETLAFFTRTITEAMDQLRALAEHHGETVSQRVRQLLLDALNKSITGMENTKETYKGDRMFVSRMEALINTIRQGGVGQ
jgi:DNA integrity scanning protein DisA with diadenylate cyclase activity